MTPKRGVLLGIGIGFSLVFVAGAGTIVDTDADGVPDVFDNRRSIANGPAGTDQFDHDGDGFGNVCDADLDNDGVVAGSDFALFVLEFGIGPFSSADFDVDGVVAGSDFGIFLSLFGSPVGPGASAI